jgi:phytanoyl-CoA hydroxylase
MNNMESLFQLQDAQLDFFQKNGYLAIDAIISAEEVARYQRIYDAFLNGTIDSGKNRSDLGAGLGQNQQTENITQIMWPSDFMPEVLQMTYHLKALSVAKALLGDDMEMDFDMLINKAPHSGTITPWHQDAAYWINLQDKRAVSCWLALDNATIDNGCMWYVPGSHLLPLRTHRNAGAKGGALTCTVEEAEGLPIELKAGSCVFHHGATLHYSRGNVTGSGRRAFIVNFRPKAMIELERSQGFDHGRNGGAGNREVRNEDTKQ